MKLFLLFVSFIKNSINECKYDLFLRIMIKLVSILWNSFKMALQELKVNKLRTFLSLFGITIGIFCIIGVLATVDSLNREINSELSSIGSNTIWVDKFDFTQMGPDFPWWKYVKRPNLKYTEMVFLKDNSKQSKYVSLFLGNGVNAEYSGTTLQNTILFGVSEDFAQIQGLKIVQGRFLSESDFARGTPVCVIGYQDAEDLFGAPQYAVGKMIAVNGRKLMIVGLIEKQGKSVLDVGFQYDQSIITSNIFFSSLFVEKNVGRNFIMVEPKEGVPIEALKEEIRGIMRQVRRLSPQDEDNFALNEVNFLSKLFDPLFATLNIAGWAIAGLSLIVGAFGVANIMFVTVRERTSQIGLKKALGAKKTTIMTEFLLESAFLCIVGGLVGLFLVWLLALGLSSVLPFSIYIAPRIIIMAFTICIVIGVLAGIIPASQAAKMDPVEAIRSK